MESLSAGCCVNTTGDPGELWCVRSSFMCKGTGTGDTACWVGPVVAGSAAAGVATVKKRLNSGLKNSRLPGFP